MVYVAARPCSSHGRQGDRWTRDECYEQARVRGIPIWNRHTRRLRRMDDICRDLATHGDGPGLLASKPPATAQAPTFDYGVHQLIMRLQLERARHAALKDRVRAISQGLPLIPMA